MKECSCGLMTPAVTSGWVAEFEWTQHHLVCHCLAVLGQAVAMNGWLGFPLPFR
jgi:hypothetical protein